jgi:hypothetical protein
MINVIAELERIGWGFNWAGDSELRCLCPFHNDSSPSCAINVEKQRFRCCTAGCGAKGDVITFLAGALKSNRADVKKDLATRYDINTDRVIKADVIEDYHSDIWAAKPLLQELYARGVTDDDIRKYRLGTKDGRVTIPIKNESGYFVNLRLYLPGAPGKDKFRNLKGRGKVRLFPIDQLKYPELLVVGGEVKAIVAARYLNPHGIGVVTSTLGESNWDPRLTSFFKDKPTTVCFDVDEEGKRSQTNTCKHLSRITKVRSALLPLDPAKFPKGDINDFIAIRGDLHRVYTEATDFAAPKKAHEVMEKPRRVDLVQAINANNAGKRVVMTCTVSTLDTSPYVIPSSVKVKCTRDIEECAVCPVYLNEEPHVYSINAESPAILEMVARPKANQAPALKEELEIPKRCQVCEFEPTSYYNVEDVRISPRLEITNRSIDRSMQPAVCIGKGVDLNETYEMMGRMYPHPQTQQSTLLISRYKTSQDALSSYRLKDLDTLYKFQPKDWSYSSLKEKLDALYDDLERNVTRIYGRRAIHLMVDLAYHSPLFLTFDQKKIKGWVEVLILGDSAQGKTETTMNLQRHYGLGEKVECKNATVAGLLGGLQQMGSRWFVSWGVIPTHDKRLVILEELKGTSTEVISKLTDMRSSGVAEIPKIEKRRTHARTRLIALSNPRSDSPIDHYSYGVDAVKELIGSLEDVRRFDACLLVSATDVSQTLINDKIPMNTPEYTSEDCRRLILWGWTASDIIFDQETTDLVLELSSKMSGKFTDTIPIVDRGSMRYKLARLAASLAIRTFSNQGESVLVRPCHVQYVHDFLDGLYSSRAFGYLDLTQSIESQSKLSDPDTVRRAIITTPFPKDFVQNLLSRMYIELQDIQDWCAWDRQAAQGLLSVLVRKHALTRRQRAYVKTSAFISFLKGLDDIPDRPDHIPEGVEF